jgi:hypothetical protein
MSGFVYNGTVIFFTLQVVKLIVAVPFPLWGRGTARP